MSEPIIDSEPQFPRINKDTVVEAISPVYHYHHANGVYLGSFIVMEDGYYHFWPDHSKGGCWSSHVLREIANKLDELNKPWDEEIQKYFRDNPPPTSGN